MDESTRAAFIKAIEEVESRSSAEVVIVQRRQSGSYLPVDMGVGIVVGLATLTYLLFGEPTFTLAAFLIEPVFFGLVFGFIGSRIPTLRCALTLKSARTERVVTAARSMFFEKRVFQTRKRTGVLIYLSLLERQVVVLPDQGIVEAVPEEEWNAVVAEIQQTWAAGLNAMETAGQIEKLAEVCEPHLIHSDDDINELPDEVCA